jgi:glutaredoxin
MPSADPDVSPSDGSDAPRTAGGVEPRITLIGKPGCHLCDTARGVVVQVAAELGIAWQEVSILDDPELEERYREKIPVIVVDGREHDYYRVDRRRLTKALTGRRRRLLGR